MMEKTRDMIWFLAFMDRKRRKSKKETEVERYIREAKKAVG